MQGPAGQQMTLPVPGRALKVIMIVLFSTWLIFALGINWGGAGENTFSLLTGNTNAIAAGQVWRLFTPLLLHDFTSVSHILGAILGLYFLGSALEGSWGPRRFLKFILAAGVLSYATQFLLQWLAPSFTSGLVGPIYFGAQPIVYAIAIAWAFSFKGQTVNLMFVLPVSARTLIFIVVGLALMTVIAGGQSPSGHIATFAGMGYGWLLGGGTPSPLRKMLLRYRLASLEREAGAEKRAKKKRVHQSGLKVLPGGKNDDDPPMLH